MYAPGGMMAGQCVQEKGTGVWIGGERDWGHDWRRGRGRWG